jgi:hypothetical protein
MVFIIMGAYARYFLLAIALILEKNIIKSSSNFTKELHV